MPGNCLFPYFHDLVVTLKVDIRWFIYGFIILDWALEYETQNLLISNLKFKNGKKIQSNRVASSRENKQENWAEKAASTQVRALHEQPLQELVEGLLATKVELCVYSSK